MYLNDSELWTAEQTNIDNLFLEVKMDLFWGNITDKKKTKLQKLRWQINTDKTLGEESPARLKNGGGVKIIDSLCSLESERIKEKCNNIMK